VGLAALQFEFLHPFRTRTAIAAALFMLGGCDGGVSPIAASDCAAPDYLSLQNSAADSFAVFAGSSATRNDTALLVVDDQKNVDALQGFLLSRNDGWHIGAGETYDPATRISGSEFTIDFRRDGKVIASFGLGDSYFETPGCGYEVLRPISPEDRARVMNLVFGTPMRDGRGG
jgi:hypothetical protein